MFRLVCVVVCCVVVCVSEAQINSSCGCVRARASVWRQCRSGQREQCVAGSGDVILSPGCGDVTTSPHCGKVTPAPDCGEVTPAPVTTTAAPTTIITTTIPTTTPSPPKPSPGPKSVPNRDEVDEDPKDPFKETSEQIIKMDMNVVDLCLKHSGVKVREIYESDGYRLIYYIPDLMTETIAVSLRHRALRVTAQRIMGPQNFTDIEILPEIVDTAQAQWEFQQGTLRILFPYKVLFNKEVDKTCKMNIYDKEVEVDQYTEEIDIRSSKHGSAAIVIVADDA